jgi:transcriptional regulator with XRE-family HTH domain
MTRKKTKLQHPQIVKDFAQKLRQARKRKGLSQQDLANAAHVNAAYLGKLERAEAAPGLDMVGRLADALKLPAAKLVIHQPEGSALSSTKVQARRKFEQVLSRDDAPVLEALTSILALLDNALARRND